MPPKYPPTPLICWSGVDSNHPHPEGCPTRQIWEQRNCILNAAASSTNTPWTLNPRAWTKMGSKGWRISPKWTQSRGTRRWTCGTTKSHKHLSVIWFTWTILHRHGWQWLLMVSTKPKHITIDPTTLTSTQNLFTRRAQWATCQITFDPSSPRAPNPKSAAGIQKL